MMRFRYWISYFNNYDVRVEYESALFPSREKAESARNEWVNRFGGMRGFCSQVISVEEPHCAGDHPGVDPPSVMLQTPVLNWKWAANG